LNNAISEVGFVVLLMDFPSFYANSRLVQPIQPIFNKQNKNRTVFPPGKYPDIQNHHNLFIKTVVAQLLRVNTV
jgi:hypothetical protein